MTKQERTQRVIDCYRGNADEFAMLKGILCSAHNFTRGNLTGEQYDVERAEQKKIEAIFDHQMIAARMDEINRDDVVTLADAELNRPEAIRHDLSQIPGEIDMSGPKS